MSGFPSFFAGCEVSFFSFGFGRAGRYSSVSSDFVSFPFLGGALGASRQWLGRSAAFLSYGLICETTAWGRILGLLRPHIRGQLAANPFGAMVSGWALPQHSYHPAGFARRSIRRIYACASPYHLHHRRCRRCSPSSLLVLFPPPISSDHLGN